MSLILPPRLDDRAAEAAARIEIPIYEAESFDSLRPTWLPIDPSTYRPPPKRSRGAALANVAKFSLLLFVTFGVAFSSVVGPHFAREYVARRAAAASNANVAKPVVPENQASHARAAADATRSADAVTLTIDVMNLPVSKDFPQKRKAKRRAAGS
jgi:hypothetical protein